eukprot:TRINITY_DN4495_c0_g1_i2.p1 TRINITY_DN4495_c0_g1~~TRINITY_DN4495_c0_g1_i2.p1  ORF type:complete len:351 (+),score=24.00 TRINITY_DN4495_c0_g1_i2:31-1083(+)
MSPPSGATGDLRLPAPLLHSAAGLISGMVANILTYPLDFVKVRYIAQDGTGSRAMDGVARFKGVIHAIKKSYSVEGLLPMYKGVGVSLQASSLSWGIYFGTYSYLRNGYQKRLPGVSQSLGNFCSATFAGCVATTITCPLWLIKTRMQLQRGASSPQGPSVERYRGTFHGLRSIQKTEGFRGWYSGLAPSLLMVSHGSVQMTLYEGLKSWCSSFHAQPGSRLSTWEICFSTLTSKCIASMFTTPLVVLRIRVQDPRNSLSETDVRYSQSVIRAFQTIVHREGYAGLYRGLIPTLVRTVPNALVIFLSYESISSFLLSTFGETRHVAAATPASLQPSTVSNPALEVKQATT